MKIAIDVISDVICPWCFLGKRRLDKALSLLDGIEVEINWRPFLLDPTIPREGMGRVEYLIRKFGAARLATIHDPLIAAGKAEGVPYRFDAITRTPNTIDAHRLIRWSHEKGRQHEMAERLFMAYWNEGKDVGDHGVLADAAEAIGLERGKVLADLAGDLDTQQVMAEIAMAADIGVTGVPTFILGGRYGVVGAQGPKVLAEVIRKAAEESLSVTPAEAGVHS